MRFKVLGALSKVLGEDALGEVSGPDDIHASVFRARATFSQLSS